MRSILSKIQWTDDLQPWHIITFFNLKTPQQRGISFCYKLLTGTGHTSKSPMILQWEQKLQCSYTPQQWYRTLQPPLKISRCLLHWETVQKLFHNWYLTPSKLAWIYPNSTNLCWRNCGSPGTPLHIWWDCPILTKLWTMLSKLLSILPDPVPLTPQMVLLGLDMELWPQARSSSIYLLQHAWLLPKIGNLPIPHLTRK